MRSFIQSEILFVIWSTSETLVLSSLPLSDLLITFWNFHTPWITLVCAFPAMDQAP